MDTTAVLSDEYLRADRGGTLLGAVWTWTAFAMVFVGARFFCRIRLVRSIWWDDWMMLAALSTQIALGVILTMYAYLGGCQHSAAIPPDQLVKILRLNWISTPPAIAGLVFGKLSVAFLILRFQAPTPLRTHLMILSCVVLVFLGGLSFSTVFWQCSPIAMLWDHSIVGNCHDTISLARIGEIVGAYFAFHDLFLAAVPVQMIWGLQMPKQKKIAVCILLSTGVSAFAFAILKILHIHDATNWTDLNWTGVLLFVWNTSETNMIIIAGCVPTIVPLFHILTGRKTLASYIPNRSGGSAGYNGYHPHYSIKIRSDAERLDSMSKEEPKGGKRVPGIRSSSTVVATEASSSDTWYDSNSDKIAVTRQWAVTESERRN
ncbi:hypothetical protein BJ875DRAFT_526660 [Amylocarpus encephaloides]|uniref:Rhodopsin domain-containing protein n=1 Tax=Amylocarpus encephaloides TaxID=45428 RepID=A0A9P7Y8M8_9HELO|nr:hypothetical protein BJ875DRAFT_526660 [Amylocarpus encephaloides]